MLASPRASRGWDPAFCLFSLESRDADGSQCHEVMSQFCQKHKLPGNKRLTCSPLNGWTSLCSISKAPLCSGSWNSSYKTPVAKSKIPFAKKTALCWNLSRTLCPPIVPGEIIPRGLVQWLTWDRVIAPCRWDRGGEWLQERSDVQQNPWHPKAWCMKCIKHAVELHLKISLLSSV